MHVGDLGLASCRAEDVNVMCVYVIAAPLATFNGIWFWFCGLPLLPSQAPDLLIYTYPCVYLSPYLSIDPPPCLSIH